MHQSPRLTLGYLHHAHAVAATEQLEALEIQSLPNFKQADRRRVLARLQRAAAGQPPETAEEARAAQEARWDTAWGQMRGLLGPPRIVAPAE